VPDVASFDDTITARWREQLGGSRSDERSHWRTKTAYYHATQEALVKAPPGRPLTWRMIVEAAEGSRTTFYDVTGRHAKHPLVGSFQAAEDTDAIQLAVCYRRTSAVDQLIDETKVWSYWPYREGWLDQMRLGHLGPESWPEGIVAAVAEWSRRNPVLAAALDYAPPACAVEDLMVVRQGQLPAMRALPILARAARNAVDRSADRGTALERSLLGHLARRYVGRSAHLPEADHLDHGEADVVATPGGERGGKEVTRRVYRLA
jgi:hypothetical protein